MARSQVTSHSLALLLTYLLLHVVCAYRHIRQPTLPNRVPSIKTLSPRAGDGGVGNDIEWTEWTAGDGVKDGKDSDGIWYIKEAIETYTTKYADPNTRIGVFWAGGVVTQDDYDDIAEFIESYTDDRGKIFQDIFSMESLEDMGLSHSQKTGLWWRAINRASKGLAAAADGGIAYVFMNNNNCRNLFSPPSQLPQDADPDHGGQATNGEIWYYAELPTLMRNLKIKQIVTFYKTKREPGKRPRFVQNVAWDVDRDKDKPRNFVADVALDASPIILPPEAGRPPLRRGLISRGGVAPIEYQAGPFDVLRPSGQSELPNSINASVWSSPSTTTLYESRVGYSNASTSISNGSSTLISSHNPRSSPLHSNTVPLPKGSNTESASRTGITGASSQSQRSSDDAVPSDVESLSTLQHSGAGSNLSTISNTQRITTTPLITLEPTSTSGFATSTVVAVTPQFTSKTPIQTIDKPSPPTTAAPVRTIPPTGVEAKSSASSLSSEIAVIAPIWQEFIDRPDKKKGEDLVKIIEDLEDEAEDFQNSIDTPDPEKGKDCLGNSNLIKDIFSAARCLKDSLQKAKVDIETLIQRNFDDLTNVKTDLKYVQNLETVFEDAKDDMDEKTERSQDQTSLSRSSSQSVCSRSQTASACSVTCSTFISATSTDQGCTTTCYSKWTGCTVTNEITTVHTASTASACPFGNAPSAAVRSYVKEELTTAWFDPGVLCAGNNCGVFASALPGSALGGSSMLSASNTASKISGIPSVSTTGGIRTSSAPLTSTQPEATTSLPPPPKTTSSPVPPPEATVAPPVCNPVPDNCKMKDVHHSVLQQCIKAFGPLTEPMHPNSHNTSKTLNNKDPRPLINVGWIPGCTSFESQNPAEPVPGNTEINAGSLFEDCYKKCTGNQGLGGYIDVGCLRYGFYPSRIKPEGHNGDNSAIFAARYFSINAYCE